jgi:hypothetical protein
MAEQTTEKWQENTASPEQAPKSGNTRNWNLPILHKNFLYVYKVKMEYLSHTTKLSSRSLKLLSPQQDDAYK